MVVRFERRAVVSAVVLVSLLLVSPGASRAILQVLPQSPEFQVNTYTPLNQSNSAIAADSQGNFVVVWEQADAVPSPDNIVARRFNSAGAGLGPEFQVNVFTIGVQRQPWVARSAAGSFVVVWASNGQDGDNYGVFGRRFDASGNALATEFQINTHTTSVQRGPRVAMGSGGDFVVVWHSNLQDGDGYGVFGRRFDAGGAALGAEFQVNTYVTLDQFGATVARKDDGGFIVSWNSDGQDGGSYGIFARRFASDGSPLGVELQVNAYTIGAQRGASVAYAAEGFVAVWHSQDQDGSGYGLFASGFDSSGVRDVDGEGQVNIFTTGDQFSPVALAVGSRHFVVVWNSAMEDGSSYGVFARAFGGPNDEATGEFLVNTTTISAQLNARAATAGQRFVVVWQSAGQDGSNNGVFGRRFVIPLTLDVDGDGQVLPLTDGTLTLRYEFGFRGATLITAAVGPQCTRCDAPSIVAYLDSV